MKKTAMIKNFFAILVVSVLIAMLFFAVACGGQDIPQPAPEPMPEVEMPGVISAVNYKEGSADLKKEQKGPDGGWNIGAIKDGTYVLYTGLTFGGRPDKLKICHSGDRAAELTFRLGGPEGEIIARFKTEPTGSYMTYTTSTFDVTYEGEDFSGMCDIYVGINSGLNFAWFEFVTANRETHEKLDDATLEDIYRPEERPDYNFDYDYEYKPAVPADPDTPTPDKPSVPEGYVLYDCGNEFENRVQFVKYGDAQGDYKALSGIINTVIEGGDNESPMYGRVIGYNGTIKTRAESGETSGFRLATKMNSKVWLNKTHSFIYNIANLGGGTLHFRLDQVNKGNTVEPANESKHHEINLAPGQSTTIKIDILFTDGTDNSNALTLFTVLDEITDMKLGIAMAAKLAQ